MASRAVGQAKKYLQAGAAVGPYLADQLLIPMALAADGGKSYFQTSRPTRHTTTNIDVIRQFLDIAVSVSQVDELRWKITVG